MIEVKEGNVIDAVLSGECDFMLHITNGQQKMGSGVAKEVRERIPTAYTNYMLKPKNKVSVTRSDDYKCFNLTAQQYYGREKGKRYLSYKALCQCLMELSDWDFLLQDHFDTGDLKIAIPYLIGSDRAGGDWDIVCEILEAFLGHHEIIAYKL